MLWLMRHHPAPSFSLPLPHFLLAPMPRGLVLDSLSSFGREGGKEAIHRMPFSFGLLPISSHNSFVLEREDLDVVPIRLNPLPSRKGAPLPRLIFLKKPCVLNEHNTKFFLPLPSPFSPRDKFVKSIAITNTVCKCRCKNIYYSFFFFLAPSPKSKSHHPEFRHGIQLRLLFFRCRSRSRFSRFSRLILLELLESLAAVQPSMKVFFGRS